MCFTKSARLCVICLTLHTLTGLLTITNANDGPNLSTQQPTISSEKHQHPVPDKTSSEHDHDHEETSKQTSLADELSNAQNFYVKDLIDRFGSDGVLGYDGIIHLLENLGINPEVLPAHSHEGHSHPHSHSHADHSHDADHSKHIHDSDHEKHNPETDHEDHHHDNSDHENHDHDIVHKEHDHELDHENHDHDLDHENHGHNLDHENHDHESDHENHDHESDHEDHDHNLDHENHDHPHQHSNKSLDTHDNEKHRRRRSSVLRQKRNTQNETKDTHNHSDDTDDAKCDDLFNRFHIQNGQTVTTDRLLKMCPGILSALSRPECRKNTVVHEDHTHQVKLTDGVAFKDIRAEVWGYSTIAIVVISMVGLLGVAVVPIMQKVFYNHLLLFLVALAVGALSGDALLHLLPHALQGGHNHGSHGNSDEEDTHKAAVLKGLCGMGAIFLFFTMERVLSIVTDLKRKHKKQKGSVFVKEGEINDSTNIPLTECGAMRVNDPDCKEQIMGIHPGQKALTNFAESSHKKCSREHEDHQDKNKQFDMVDEENPSSVLSHSHHHHGHSHILPTSVASIAWMVILGDGIHNFCDGLAIGAAFSSSITGGFSTSVAVFCHELPHEIGDFAVLLRAGMTVKQAIMYNCVSSILAFIGMLIGVGIGNFDDSITWVFVSVAGMFLYIALVDMLPELTAVDTRQGEHPFSHLVIQVGGMILGASIMLVIALYEENLMNILEPV